MDITLRVAPGRHMFFCMRVPNDLFFAFRNDFLLFRSDTLAIRMRRRTKCKTKNDYFFPAKKAGGPIPNIHQLLPGRKHGSQTSYRAARSMAAGNSSTSALSNHINSNSSQKSEKIPHFCLPNCYPRVLVLANHLNILNRGTICSCLIGFHRLMRQTALLHGTAQRHMFIYCHRHSGIEKPLKKTCPEPTILSTRARSVQSGRSGDKQTPCTFETLLWKPQHSIFFRQVFVQCRKDSMGKWNTCVAGA